MKHSRLFKPIWLIAMLLLLSATSFTASAYDFMADGIAYNINSGGTSVSVTYTNYQSSINYNGLPAANIPSSVTYNGTTYSVTSIGEKAFYWCSSLTNVTIPNSVTTIGSQAFSSCSSLTSVTIPNSVTTIGSQAFQSCSGLKKLNWNAFNCSLMNSMPSSIETLTIGNQVQVLPDYFVSGSKITSVNIPNSVISIGYQAFQGCTQLTRITIPNSVTSIGEQAFLQCSGLTSVTIPNSVTSISQKAFRDCSSLTSVTIPNSITSIGHQAFLGCSSLTSVTIPNSVTTIGEGAFSGCSSLKSVNIPSASEIGLQAFAYCTDLMSVRIGNSTNSTVIGNRVFYECEGLTSVILPASLSALGEEAFSGCTGLTDVTCMRPRPVNINANVFKNVPVNGGCDLHVPEGSKIRYEAMAVWQDFLFIVEDAEDTVPPPTPNNGDVNGDGKVNVSDVSALINIILGIS